MEEKFIGFLAWSALCVILGMVIDGQLGRKIPLDVKAHAEKACISFNGVKEIKVTATFLRVTCNANDQAIELPLVVLNKEK